jgi:hypothetical protein
MGPSNPEQASRARAGGLGGVACFAASLAAGSALLHAALEQRLPPRIVLAAPGKLAALERLSPVDVVFIGTSRVHTDVDPRVVDARLRDAGRAWRSFNLGVPALTIVEELRLVERLRALPAPPRYVILEPVLNANAELQNVSTDRVIAGHDPAATRLQLAWVASTDARPLRKLRFAALHLLALGYDLLNVGKVPRLLHRTPDPGDASVDDGARGFASVDPSGSAPDPHRDLMASGRAFQMLREASRFDPSGPPLPEVQADTLEGVLQSVRSLGSVPVLLLPPRFDWDAEDGRTVINRSALDRFLRTHAREHASVPLLRYDDPGQAADLYDPGLWSDSNHLNADGARLFSERLGRDLALLLATGP